jgi:oligopeptide/dipeptide ABC transporter ATP-binding protein
MPLRGAAGGGMSASAELLEETGRGLNGSPLVAVDHLSRHFGLGGRRAHNVVRAVDDVSFAIPRGETFGLVGESGSGKSTLARLLVRLDRPTAGSVLFDDRDIFASPPHELRRLRREMQIVFQDPFASLNRRKTVEQIVSLPLRVHEPGMSRPLRAARVGELLELVGLRHEHASAYPRQLSGGQCQRVSIARALALGPKFVVLDEAVSAVDVSIQAQILNLLRDLQGRLGLTYLFVTHDLSVVRYMASTIAVMYLGRIVELGSRERLFESPLHPYTHALLASIPSGDPEDTAREHAAELVVRDAPGGGGLPSGCRFHPRCPLGQRELCRTVDPPLHERAPGHVVACHFPQTAESLLVEAARAAG